MWQQWPPRCLPSVSLPRSAAGPQAVQSRHHDFKEWLLGLARRVDLTLAGHHASASDTAGESPKGAYF